MAPNLSRRAAMLSCLVALLLTLDATNGLAQVDSFFDVWFDASSPLRTFMQNTFEPMRVRPVRRQEKPPTLLLTVRFGNQITSFGLPAKKGDKLLVTRTVTGVGAFIRRPGGSGPTLVLRERKDETGWVHLDHYLLRRKTKKLKPLQFKTGLGTGVRPTPR